MARPEPNPGILNITPYAQGKAALPGVREPVKLSSNELPHGPSPQALDAFHAAAGDLNRYPDGAQTKLREAIAAKHGLEVERIICGNGSDELIGLLIRAYIGSGDELLLSAGHFVMCPIYATAQGGNVVMAPEQNHRVDVDAIIGHVTPHTRLVAIANPNTPAGTYLTDAELRRLHADLPAEVLLLIDSAYAEFVGRDDYEAGAALVREADNVVMTRTFSKAYGLAGLRIGWAYCPAHVVDVIQRIRTPFNTNSAALAAATAALADVAFIERVREHNSRWLQRIRQELAALGLDVAPSVTNFYLVDFDGCNGKSAREAAAHLEAQGIIPRPVGTRGGENVLRITVGSDAENEALLASLREYMTGPGRAGG